MTRPAELRLRIATVDDRELLKKLRIECGWGEDKVQTNLGKQDYPYCIFTLGEEDHDTVVGMAGWVLEFVNDPETASRESKTVYLTSLFIRDEYQGMGLGSKAMDLLEFNAKERFGAEWITLDTAQWKNERVAEFIWVEHIGIEGRNPKWYAARGYRPYREPTPFFHCPTAEDPEHKLTAAFLRKPASAVVGTSDRVIR